MKKTRRRGWNAVGAVLVCTFALASAVGAQQARRAVLTFSGPLSLPTVTLPAGTYVFEIKPDRPEVVLISDKDNRFITANAVRPVTRPTPGHIGVVLRHTSAEASPEIATLYFEGTEGYEFAYTRPTAVATSGRFHK